MPGSCAKETQRALPCQAPANTEIHPKEALWCWTTPGDIWVHRPVDVSRQTLQHTSTPSSAAPPQVEEGEITSTAWAPLHPDPVPLAACSPVPVPGELCLWAWFILCCATSPLSRGSCMPQRFPDYSNTGTVKERKDSKGKKYFSRLKNFIWCTV